MKRRTLALFFALLCLTGGGPGRAQDGALYPLEPAAPLWRTYDPALHFYYGQLTDPEKRAFAARYDCLALGDPALWDEGTVLDETAVMRVDFALLTDCPELMYMPSTVGAQGELLKPDAAECARHPGDIERMLEACRGVIEEIANRPEWGERDFDRQLAADRYVAARCRYAVEVDFGGGDFAPDPALRTAWASLAGGEAACAGYAQGMQLALRCMGIPSLMTYGYVEDDAGNATPHAWNISRIDGAWYHHDATMNDRDMEDFLPYFNLSDEAVRRTHAEDPAGPMLRFDLPACGGMAANYYAVRGQTLGADWREALPGLIQRARDAGRSALGVRFEGDRLYGEALAALEAGEWGDAPPWRDIMPWRDLNLIWFGW